MSDSTPGYGSCLDTRIHSNLSILADPSTNSSRGIRNDFSAIDLLLNVLLLHPQQRSDVLSDNSPEAIAIPVPFDKKNKCSETKEKKEFQKKKSSCGDDR